MNIKYFKISAYYILFGVLCAPSLTNADSGALYDAWENGEAVITTEESSLINGGFFYSPDEEMVAPPPPKKPKWERFKSLEEHGAIGRVPAEEKQKVPSEYENYNSDPFANRINDIESLLSSQ